MSNASFLVSASILACFVYIQQPADAGNTIQTNTPSVPNPTREKQKAEDLLGTQEINLRTSQSDEFTPPPQTGIALKSSDLDFVRLEPALRTSDFSRVDEDTGLKILLESIDNRRK
jgi:hypothetical protein